MYAMSSIHKFLSAITVEDTNYFKTFSTKTLRKHIHGHPYHLRQKWNEFRKIEAKEET